MRSILCVVLLGGIINCSGGDPTGATSSTPAAKDFTDAFPEHRGDFLPMSDITTNSMIRWEDPGEIVYYTEGSAVVQRLTYVRALRLSDNTTRTLHTGGTSDGYQGYHGLFVSPDGKQFYVSLSKPLGGDFDMYQIIPGAASVRVASGSKVGSLIPTPDSRGAAYLAYPDTVGFYDVATRTSRTVGVGCDNLRAFSPDGKSILCSSRNDLLLMSVADGSVQKIATSVSSLSSAFHWDYNGLEVAYATMDTGSGAVLRNITTGIETTLVDRTEWRLWEGALYSNLTWSHDGRKVAFSSNRYQPYTDFAGEFVVYVIDVTTGAMTHVAAMRLKDSDIGAIAFSPDGNSLVYLMGTNTYAEAYRVAVP